MKPLQCPCYCEQSWRGLPFPSVPILFLAVIICAGNLGRAGGIVADCTEASLRAAMAGGGPVTFACDGTIILSNTITNLVNTVFDGSGHQITISGDNKVRVFVNSTNVSLVFSNLTIANGFSDQGAGLANFEGQVILQNCNLAGNVAQGGPVIVMASTGPGTNGYGGAVYNVGILNALNCSFMGNSAGGGNGASLVYSYGMPGGQGIGGAIANFGTLIVSNCLLANNSADGGAGGFSGWRGWFSSGQSGGPGGDGNGGAIGNFGTLTLDRCLLAGNSCTGGPGGNGGDGAQGYYPWDSAGSGGFGGGGNGGAVFNSGSAVLVNNTFALNLGVGGKGADGGNGGPPIVQGDTSGRGGSGGNGGSGYGAIYDGNGQCYLTNCTIALSTSSGGIGGLGGQPGPYNFPGPPYIGPPGPNGPKGLAAGLGTAGTHLFNTLLSGNTPTNCLGTKVDAGHNLSSDGSCAFSGVGSLNNQDPGLGPLADNGGPTFTMALLPGSPAIGAGSAIGAPATDQRGVPRPQGPGVDIGAFEYEYIPVFMGAKLQAATNCLLQMAGLLPNQSFSLLASPNLLSWVVVSNNIVSSNGLFQCVDPISCNVRARFYLIKSNTP